MCPVPHTSAYRPESKLLKTDGDQRTKFKMGPVHAWDNGQGVSGINQERTARYWDLLYARTGIGCHRSPKEYTHEITTHQAGGRGVGVPVHPTETPGGLQVKSQELVV